MTNNIFKDLWPEQNWILDDAEAQEVVIETLNLCYPRIKEIGETFRRSYDRIYMESGRFEYKALKNTEKCNLGNIFQDEILKTLKLENRKKGRDTLIANVEVDVKFTSSSSYEILLPTGWRIPPECSSSVLFLASSNDYRASWNIGIIRCNPKILSKSENRDGKRTLNALGKKGVIWLSATHKTIPENDFLGLNPENRLKFAEGVEKINRSKGEEYRKLLNSYKGNPK